jgi:hypothetical protein
MTDLVIPSLRLNPDLAVLSEAVHNFPQSLQATTKIDTK